MCVQRGAESIGSKTRCSWFVPQMVEYRCVINIIRTLTMSWIPSPVLHLDNLENHEMLPVQEATSEEAPGPGHGAKR